MSQQGQEEDVDPFAEELPILLRHRVEDCGKTIASTKKRYSERFVKEISK